MNSETLVIEDETMQVALEACHSSLISQLPKVSFDAIDFFDEVCLAFMAAGDDLAKQRHVPVEFYPEDELWIDITPFMPYNKEQIGKL